MSTRRGFFRTALATVAGAATTAVAAHPSAQPAPAEVVAPQLEWARGYADAVQEQTDAMVRAKEQIAAYLAAFEESFIAPPVDLVLK